MHGRFAHGLFIALIGLAVNLPLADGHALAAEPDAGHPAHLPTDQTRPPGVHVDPREPGPSVTFLPDLRVSYVKKWMNGQTTVYVFHITNIGIGIAFNVNLTAETGQTSANLVKQETSQVIYAMIDSWHTEVLEVPCTPENGWTCVGVSLSANIANDLDTSNNYDGGK